MGERRPGNGLTTLGLAVEFATAVGLLSAVTTMELPRGGSRPGLAATSLPDRAPPIDGRWCEPPPAADSEAPAAPPQAALPIAGLPDTRAPASLPPSTVLPERIATYGDVSRFVAPERGPPTLPEA